MDSTEIEITLEPNISPDELGPMDIQIKSDKTVWGALDTILWQSDEYIKLGHVTSQTEYIGRVWPMYSVENKIYCVQDE